MPTSPPKKFKTKQKPHKSKTSALSKAASSTFTKQIKESNRAGRGLRSQFTNFIISRCPVHFPKLALRYSDYRLDFGFVLICMPSDRETQSPNHCTSQCSAHLQRNGVNVRVKSLKNKTESVYKRNILTIKFSYPEVDNRLNLQSSLIFACDLCSLLNPTALPLWITAHHPEHQS